MRSLRVTVAAGNLTCLCKVLMCFILGCEELLYRQVWPDFNGTYRSPSSAGFSSLD